jgi:hypothetical protein
MQHHGHSLTMLIILHLLLHFAAYVVSALVELFPGQAPHILPAVLANAIQIQMMHLHSPGYLA